MTVFIDTNVLLDFMCRREPYYENAYRIFCKAANHEIDITVSALTIVNTQYTAKKYGLSNDTIFIAINNLLRLISVSPIDGRMIRRAYTMDNGDKEDVIQFLSAESVNADFILTRDKKGFVNSPVTVLSPSDFLEKLEHN